MREIRIHGRGGQGAVTAGIILAQALFNSGKYVQTFPIFGVERRGAPVAAYVRVGDSEILQRYNVYTPRDVVVLDAALISVVDVTEGLEEFGEVFINTPPDPMWKNKWHEFFVTTIDAKEIAWKYGLGSKQAPVVNTVMVGAYLAMRQIDLKHGLDAVETHAPAKKQENKDALTEAYEEIMNRSRSG